MKMKNVNCMEMCLICQFCKIQFLPARKDKRLKYCSARCRSKEWVFNHPEQHRILQKKSRDKIYLVVCRNCDENIPLEKRASGVTLCSEKCRSEKRRKNNKNVE